MDKYCRKLTILVLLVIIAITIAGCGGGGGNSSGANQGSVTSVLLNAASPNVLIEGGTFQFVATALNESGKEMSGLTVNWSVDDTSFGTIDANGKFTAKNKKGTCKVTCTVGGKTKTIPVNLIEIEDPALQIVDDLASFGSTSKVIVNSKTADLVNNTKKQIVPQWANIQSAWDVLDKYGYNLALLRYIFTHTTGDMSITSNVKGTGGSSLGLGTWNVTFTDSEWRAKYTRSTSGKNDIVDIKITSTKDSASYEIHHEYLTSLMTNETWSSANITTSGILADSKLNTSTYNGTVTVNVDSDSATGLNGDFAGEMKYKFKDTANNYLNFTDCNMSLYSKASHQDSLKGTIETNDLKITGALTIDYVINQGIKRAFPSLLKVEGAIASKAADPLKLNGTFKLDIDDTDAAVFDTTKDWSASNFLGGTVGFDGTVVISSNYQFDTSLSLSTTSYNKYTLKYGYTLTSGGTSRKVTLTLEKTDTTHLKFTCDSAYGPAKLEMNLAFSSDDWSSHTWTDAMGSLTVNGVKKGTVTRSTHGIKITYDADSAYTNGTYREFVIY